MNQKLEIEQMEAAFKRAAEKATHGTREERSGRFVVSDGRSTRGESDSSLPNSGAKASGRSD